MGSPTLPNCQPQTVFLERAAPALARCLLDSRLAALAMVCSASRRLWRQRLPGRRLRTRPSSRHHQALSQSTAPLTPLHCSQDSELVPCLSAARLPISQAQARPLAPPSSAAGTFQPRAGIGVIPLLASRVLDLMGPALRRNRTSRGKAPPRMMFI